VLVEISNNALEAPLAKFVEFDFFYEYFSNKRVLEL